MQICESNDMGDVSRIQDMSSEMAVKLYFTEDYLVHLLKEHDSGALSNNLSISVNLTYGVYESNHWHLQQVCQKYRFKAKPEIKEQATINSNINGTWIVKNQDVNVTTVKYQHSLLTNFHCHKAHDDNFHFFKKLTQK